MAVHSRERFSDVHRRGTGLNRKNFLQFDDVGSGGIDSGSPGELFREGGRGQRAEPAENAEAVKKLQSSGGEAFAESVGVFAEEKAGSENDAGGEGEIEDVFVQRALQFRIEYAARHGSSVGGNNDGLLDAVPFGDLRKSQRDIVIDGPLLFFGAGGFPRGAEAGEPYIAADGFRYGFKIVEVRNDLGILRVGQPTGAAHKGDDLTAGGILEQDVYKVPPGSSAGSDD